MGSGLCLGGHVGERGDGGGVGVQRGCRDVVGVVISGGACGGGGAPIAARADGRGMADEFASMASLAQGRASWMSSGAAARANTLANKEATVSLYMRGKTGEGRIVRSERTRGGWVGGGAGRRVARSRAAGGGRDGGGGGGMLVNGGVGGGGAVGAFTQGVADAGDSLLTINDSS